MNPRDPLRPYATTLAPSVLAGNIKNVHLNFDQKEGSIGLYSLSDGDYGEAVITALCGSAVEGSIPSSPPTKGKPAEAGHGSEL